MAPGPAQVEKSSLRLAEQQAGLLWSPGCRLPWRQQTRQGGRVCWDRCNPTQIRLDARAAYAVQCTMTVCAMAPAEGEGVIRLRQTPYGTFAEAHPLRFSLECLRGSPQTLQYAAVLHPCADRTGMAELSLVLDTRNALCVERAELSVLEL